MIKKKLILGIVVIILLTLFLIVINADIPNYTISGNKVYVDDSKVYISASPHTLRGSGWVTFNLTSKVYTGDVDVVVGFDTDVQRPTSIERYNPTLEERNLSYTCNTNYFNYTTNPNYAWCYDSYNGTEVIFEHSFDSGNLEEQTIYWTEEYTDEWKEMNLDFNSVEYEYQDMDKWWYVQDVSIVQDNEYVFRVYVENDELFNAEKRKYWFAIKPSGETIPEAVSNGHLYALDPWTEGIGTGLTLYYDMNSSLERVSGAYNLTAFEGSPAYTDGRGIVGYGLVCTPNNNAKIPSTVNTNLNSSGSDATMSFWFNSTAITADRFIFDKNDGGSNGMNMYLSNGNLGCSGIVSGVTNCLADRVADTWYMVTIVHRGAYAEVWMNDTLIQNGTSALQDFDNNITLGVKNDGTSDDDTRVLDKLAFWNRSLSSSEISALYNSGSSVTYFESFIPNVTLISPSSTSTSGLELLVNVSAVDNVAISSCWANITTAGGVQEVANTELVQDGTSNYYNATLTVTSYNDFVLWYFCNDTAGYTNTTSKDISFSDPTGGGSPPSGGGGSSTVILGESGWIMQVLDGVEKFEIQMVSGTARKLGIELENIGESERIIQFSCEDVEGEICQYVTFIENPITLPLLKDVKTEAEFLISLPNEVEDGNYIFNIIGTDEIQQKGTISVYLGVGTAGFFLGTISKLGSRTEGGFPYLIIFSVAVITGLLLFGRIIPKKTRAKEIFVVGFSLLGSFILIYFI